LVTLSLQGHIVVNSCTQTCTHQFNGPNDFIPSPAAK